MLTALGGNSDLISKLSSASPLVAGTVNTNNSSVLRQSVDMAGAFLKQKLQGTATVAPDANKTLGTNLSAFSGGLSSLKNMIPALGTFGQQAKSALITAPLQDKMSVQGILSQALPLAQTAASDFNSYKAILSTLISYASSHNIKIPAIAQSLLSGN
ncbi:MAG: hypothetical protein HQL15_06890 [Candidatus Omnitrophica bacterium]|nr:hypothetical protein [Candidatus Omnitrophota bacterium]